MLQGIMVEALGMNCGPFMNILHLEESSPSAVLPHFDALASTTSQLCLPPQLLGRYCITVIQEVLGFSSVLASYSLCLFLNFSLLCSTYSSFHFSFTQLLL